MTFFSLLIIPPISVSLVFLTLFILCCCFQVLIRQCSIHSLFLSFCIYHVLDHEFRFFFYSIQTTKTVESAAFVF